MFMKRFIPVALAGLLFAGHTVFAEETAARPEQGEAAAVVSVEAVEPAPAQETAEPSGGGMEMGGSGMAMDAQGGSDKSMDMMMPPGMAGPGMPGCRMGKGGMKGMMPGAAMGGGGMMGCGMMGKGCKTGCCAGHPGITQEQYRELMGRLDVLDARTAKIDAMLERLLER